MLGREKGAVPFFGLVLTLRLSASAGEKDLETDKDRKNLADYSSLITEHSFYFWPEIYISWTQTYILN